MLTEHGDEAKVLAGGQSLVPLLNFRFAGHRFWSTWGGWPLSSASSVGMARSPSAR